MKEKEVYKLGDIVRWRDSKIVESYDYGMIIKEPYIVTSGTYRFAGETVEFIDVKDSSFIHGEPVVALTVFSFGDQRVITIYRNPEEIPYSVEKVNFIKSEKSS
tara:strand:- start:717 stop:1028 length:312 start_codon:yes stop_codon:yes gene_type:complete